MLEDSDAEDSDEDDHAKKMKKDKKQEKEKKKKKKKTKKKKKDKKDKKKQKKDKNDNKDNKKRDKKHRKNAKEASASDTSESDDEVDMADRITRFPIPNTDQKLKAFIELFESMLAQDPEKDVFIDFYGGRGKCAARAESKYGLIGISIDDATHPAWSLHTEGVVPYMRKKIKSGRIKGGHIATECTTFTPARHGKEGDNCPKPLRDYAENTWGFPDLSEKDKAALEVGNKDARLTLELIDLFVQHHVPISVENGDSSILWHLPEMAERLANARVFKVDYCMMGRAFRKRTRLAAWAVKNTDLADKLEQECTDKYHCLSKKSICCRTGLKHVILRGWARGKALSAQGKVYPRKFANLIAKLHLG